MVDGQRDLTDPMDRFWTREQAAGHLGVTLRTVQIYIHDGLPIHFPLLGGYVDRDELLAEFRKRAGNKKASRTKKLSA